MEPPLPLKGPLLRQNPTLGLPQALNAPTLSSHPPSRLGEAAPTWDRTKEQDTDPNHEITLTTFKNLFVFCIQRK